ncbi:MAG: response regulator [Deltaproteobacteria bacterium]|nr:response regulator [Deltaproteobacteria bacterium]
MDDEPELGTVAMNMLGSLGYRVHFESESLEALQRFMEDPRQFDLVISDVTMPNMTGDAVAREFLKIRPDIPIILCTGFSSQLNESQAESMGVRECLKKPLRMKDLVRSIRNILDE